MEKPLYRPVWDETWLNTAMEFAKRSTCPRRHTGAVIVTWDNQIISAGYNGSPRGLEHCTEVGCEMENDHCIRAVHAEMNAITQAARMGMPIGPQVATTIYCTDVPCKICSKLIVQAGIRQVIVERPYGGPEVIIYAGTLFASADLKAFWYNREERKLSPMWASSAGEA